jgi:hypothetical protein
MAGRPGPIRRGQSPGALFTQSSAALRRQGPQRGCLGGGSELATATDPAPGALRDPGGDPQRTRRSVGVDQPMRTLA